jgi:hypothetical protein
MQSEATKLYIKSNNTICLSIDREGGEVLHIKKMQGNYLGTTVSVDAEGALSLGAFSGYQRSAYAANFSFSTQASYC